jgi:hypothetical protein
MSNIPFFQKNAIFLHIIQASNEDMTGIIFFKLSNIAKSLIMATSQN